MLHPALAPAVERTRELVTGFLDDFVEFIDIARPAAPPRRAARRERRSHATRATASPTSTAPEPPIRAVVEAAVQAAVQAAVRPLLRKVESLDRRLAVGDSSALSRSASSSYTTAALVADYIRAKKVRGRSAGTLKFYAGLAKTLLANLPHLAQDITHRELLGYVERRRAQGAGVRVHMELVRFLRPALKLARKSKFFADDPRDVIPDLDSMAKPRTRSLSVAEAWSIVRSLEKRSKAGRDHAACFAWAVATGAEYAAWSRAKVADVREDRRGSHVHGTKNANRERFAPAFLSAQQELLDFAMKRAAGTRGALFRKWTLTNANSDLREVCEVLGIEPCSTHDVRRTFTDWWLDAGVRDSLVDVALGHMPSTVLAKHYRRGRFEPDKLLELFEADVAAHARLDGSPAVAQSAPVQSAGDLRTAPTGATEFPGRPTDGPIAQSVELRTFNP